MNRLTHTILWMTFYALRSLLMLSLAIGVIVLIGTYITAKLFLGAVVLVSLIGVVLFAHEEYVKKHPDDR